LGSRELKVCSMPCSLSSMGRCKATETWKVIAKHSEQSE
jgi:hypothetical protein